MRKIGSKAIVLVVGVALLAWLIYRTGPRNIIENIARLGWGSVLVIALGGIALVVRTWAWRFTLVRSHPEVSFTRMLALRLGSEAVGQLGFVGTMFGDGLRASLLGGKMPSVCTIASVTLDRALFTLSAAVVTVLGLVIALVFWPLPYRIAIFADVIAAVVALGITAAAVVVQKRLRFISGAARATARIPRLGAWIETTWLRKRYGAIESVEEQLLFSFRDRPGASVAGLALNFVCHAAAVLEVWLVLHLLGVHVGLTASLAAEALTKIVNGVGGFNPGNIGTYEGGTMLITKLLGFGGTTGLALAFARRTRAIFWAAVGAVCLVFISKRNQHPDQSPEPDLKGKVEPLDDTGTAVILADRLYGYNGPRTSFPRVGATPIPLRIILGLRKAGFQRIVVVIAGATGESAEDELVRTRRVPNSVEWFETGNGRGTLVDLVASLAAASAGKISFISGNRTYHPTLFQILGDWKGEEAGLVLTAGQTPVGACVLGISSALTFAASVQSNASSTSQLERWLLSTQGLTQQALTRIEVPADRWQFVCTEPERMQAERKLDGWLIKPTDGIFARFNRRISIPISRQLIRLPITPNMVSLFTLGVSFLSGLYFAMGGYRHMLAGALLGLFASILDGCDGEVARLTLQESEFGCWLETVCDYLYYLFMFAGMTIGLLRSSGTRVYLYLGCILAFGAVMSFVTTALQRRRLTAAGRPEQLLGNWQKEAERRRSNPLLYMARHTEFIVRRCFLPYAILFFAVFRIIPVAFVFAAAGANLVWPIALYSYWTFPAPSGSAT
jgi:phosphatidylglycerophosphate synthase